MSRLCVSITTCPLSTMGNDQSTGKYVVKFPDGFDELHTSVDNGLSYFKNDLGAAQRSGRATNGIKERAANRKKLKGFEMDINRMESMKVQAMATKTKKYTEQDFDRWQEMMDELKQLYLECKSLMEGNARKRSAKKSDDRATADDFLRGDGGKPAAERKGSGNLRTGKMSEQEKQAMQEINDKDEIMDDLTDQITENLEFLNMRAEMIGEEIDSQKELVEEVRVHGLGDSRGSSVNLMFSSVSRLHVLCVGIG